MLQSLLDQRYIYIIDEYIYINDLCVMGRSDHSIPKGILYCLNAKNGVKIWEKSCIVNSDCLFVNRYLYFITNDGNFYCLEKTTGEEKYQYKTDKTGVYATLCITDAFIYFTIDNTLYCLDVESGRKIWKFQSSYNIKALQASDGYVYFSDNIDRNVYCLDGRTAKKVWEFKRRYSSSIRKRNVNFWMANGFIYLSRSCLDAKTGEELWVIPHEPFCIVDGYIYLQDNTRFYCMDTGNRGINAGN
jgi:outer membrane protein assembly factor BamB